eukprot:12921166-Prorocentrum_lima.AAC.1
MADPETKAKGGKERRVIQLLHLQNGRTTTQRILKLGKIPTGKNPQKNMLEKLSITKTCRK